MGSIVKLRYTVLELYPLIRYLIDIFENNLQSLKWIDCAYCIFSSNPVQLFQSAQAPKLKLHLVVVALSVHN